MRRLLVGLKHFILLPFYIIGILLAGWFLFIGGGMLIALIIN